MIFNKYDKVVINDPRLPGDAHIGTVINTYNITPDNTAIVQLDSGETVKAPFSSLLKYDPPQENQEPKTEIPAGARRITEKEFTEAVFSSMRPTGDDLLFDLAAPIVGLTIVKMMFEDTDVIYLTEDQLVKTLWDKCSPERLANAGNKKLSFRHYALLSTTVIAKLFDIVNIFFPNGSENA